MPEGYGMGECVDSLASKDTAIKRNTFHVQNFPT